ncbi:MAG: hypothetical protein QXU67_05585 [Candidatus Bathyarchaeia archaeon]
MEDYIWFYLAVIFGFAVIALIALLFMEWEKKRKILSEPEKTVKRDLTGVLPQAASKTVSDDLIKETKDKLRILDLEREILSYAIRRLYEAHAEGKITAEERDSLTLKYKEDLDRIKQEIARGESIIALNEMERMQEDFIKMFSEKFEILNRRIEELRAITGLAPQPLIVKPGEPEKEKEEAEALPQQPEKASVQRRRKEAVKPKATAEQPEKEKVEEGEAEKRVEQIMAEVEKVLNRLSQMEIEE